MEDHWIESLRTKLIDTDISALKQLSLSRVEIVDDIKRSQNQRFNDETKIKELTSNLIALKVTLYAQTEILEHNSNKLSKEKDYLEELEVENKRLLQEIKQLEGKHNSMKSAKPNLQDQQLLEHGWKKLKLYKELTKVHWDYEAIKSCVKGYVSNRCDYIHHFSYEINEKLIDSLWHEIYLSTVKEIKDEGLPSN